MKKVIALIGILSLSLFCDLKGQTGQALIFDGTNDFVYCGNILGTSYTKEGWVMLTNSSLSNNIFGGGGDGQHTLWAPALYSNRLSAGHNGVWNQVQDPTPLTVGVWYHVAVTYDASTATMKLYKNGVLVSTNTSVPAYTGGTALRLGTYGVGASYFAGRMDEVRIWNTARTQTEISSNMSCQLIGTPSGLQQYYQFNQGTASGNNAGITSLTDIAGTAQNGTLTNFALNGSTSNWIAPGNVSIGVTASISGQTNTSCNAGSDGTATVSATGGNSYSYSWAPSGGTGATGTGLSAGTYTCTVTSECSQTATATVQITEPTAVTVNPSSGGPICNGQSTALSAAASGGTGGYTYLWNPGSMTSANPSVSPTTTTTYSVDVMDANGCGAFGTVTVTVNNGPTVNVTSNPSNGTVCAGSPATLTATGAQSYSWTGGVTNGVPFTPTITSTYTVTGTGSNGCTTNNQATITVQNCSPSASTVPCGQTVQKKNQSLSATSVVGATQYRFTFYDNSSLVQVAQVTQTSRTFVFTSAPALCYGTTYRWTVAVNTGSGFGTESSLNCTVTLAVPATTVGCGVSYSNLGVTSAAVLMPGTGIQNYIFRFYNNATNNLIATYNSTSQYVQFSQVAGLAYGNTYKWTVQLRFSVPGGGNALGAESNLNCTVTFNPPVTTVPCNGTYNRNTGVSNAAPASGATGYRFTFYQGMVQVAQRAQTSNYLYFTNVTGISNGQTYQWTVEVQYNPGTGNVYGPASTPCNISFSGSARLSLAGVELDAPVENSAQFNFGISMYPNPVGNGINPTINITGADQKNAIVTVIDLAGRTVASYNLFVEGNEYSTELVEFPELVAGMYIMQVTIDDKVQSQKFIAE